MTTELNMQKQLLEQNEADAKPRAQDPGFQSRNWPKPGPRLQKRKTTDQRQTQSAGNTNPKILSKDSHMRPSHASRGRHAMPKAELAQGARVV